MIANSHVALDALYGGIDPRDRPLYSFPDASRATEIPASTLRAWFVGTTYGQPGQKSRFHPVIRRPSDDDSRLSFTNLIEAHVLRALRTVHAVALDHVREAVAIAEAELGISRLLIHPELRTSGGRLFLDRYTDLLELSRSRQIAMRAVLAQFLERVEYDDSNLPFEFYPFGRSARTRDQRIVLVSPFISFGSPVIARRGISTRAVVQRIDAGETLEEISEDYQLTQAELEEAVLFEAAA